MERPRQALAPSSPTPLPIGWEEVFHPARQRLEVREVQAQPRAQQRSRAVDSFGVALRISNDHALRSRHCRVSSSRCRARYALLAPEC